MMEQYILFCIKVYAFNNACPKLSSISLKHLMYNDKELGKE